ncbi:response regulator [Marivita sp.]|uniref:response regulator n=1 Tax=Marivita sp. TaxID=2003365 RepID=UPI0025C0EA3E|nr:response regulator [Marivita sp.]
MDDDQMMLDFAVRALTSLGYACLVSQDTDEALRVLDADPSIRAVIIDMRLGTGQSGMHMAQQALGIRPELGVLLTSGDHGALKVARQHLPHGVRVLPKPYRLRDLAAHLSHLI